MASVDEVPPAGEKAATSEPAKFMHYGDAQTKFVKTLPLIANENAYLADVFSS